MRRRFFDLRQPKRERANRWQIRTQAVDEEDVGAIRERAKRGCRDSADAECHAEEQTRNHPDPARHQLLCIDDDD